VLALVDRVKEAPPEEVVETFLAFRQTASAAAALPGKLADVGRALALALAPAFRGLGAALTVLQQQATQQQQQE
jgi:hypothetical protein